MSVGTGGAPATVATLDAISRSHCRSTLVGQTTSVPPRLSTPGCHGRSSPGWAISGPCAAPALSPLAPPTPPPPPPAETPAEAAGEVPAESAVEDVPARFEGPRLGFLLGLGLGSRSEADDESEDEDALCGSPCDVPCRAASKYAGLLLRSSAIRDTVLPRPCRHTGCLPKMAPWLADTLPYGKE